MTDAALPPTAFAFLQTRQSHPAKLFKGPVPDRAALLEILTAATRVPDHGKLEPWRLIVLDRAAMARTADLAQAHALAIGADSEKAAKGRGQFDIGQLAVVVISSPKSTDKVPLTEQILSAGALCMNIVTAALAKGWGANWLSGWPSHDPAFIAQAFACTPGETVAGIVHIGTVATPMPDRPRPDLSKLITWA
ncbi:nitroreductase [Cypionkella aquatica]|uniref:Putative NAD(P)H nitroreductase n=1 Tax=Cypionkella aquatica TaxID=1756042 RepID=A0AA37U314_9RHOB|nr:nitroreductase [Cypionkella aquatica]GLS86470.1 nitroreductase [Cypionkella aquatica]